MTDPHTIALDILQDAREEMRKAEASGDRERIAYAAFRLQIAYDGFVFGTALARAGVSFAAGE
jgi:hypothetical protein